MPRHLRSRILACAALTIITALSAAAPSALALNPQPLPPFQSPAYSFVSPQPISVLGFLNPQPLPPIVR